MLKVSASLVLVIILFTLFYYSVSAQYEDDSSDYDPNRVQIKVYREPTKYTKRQSYAPWGYWSQQPPDKY